jgi:hypothetical protein
MILNKNQGISEVHATNVNDFISVSYWIDYMNKFPLWVAKRPAVEVL